MRATKQGRGGSAANTSRPAARTKRHRRGQEFWKKNCSLDQDTCLLEAAESCNLFCVLISVSGFSYVSDGDTK